MIFVPSVEVFRFVAKSKRGSDVGGEAYVTPASIPRSCGAQVAPQQSLVLRTTAVGFSLREPLRQLVDGFVEQPGGADVLLRAYGHALL